jgi:glycosyltransferase involved in cell wall biosynthesis
MKILYICSEFYAGMMPFGSSIVNTMKDSEHDIYAIFVSSEKCNYKNTVKPNSNDNFVFIDTPEDKLNRGYFRLFGFPIKKALKKILKENKIDIIHLLTEDTSLLSFVKHQTKEIKIFYTVHDLKQHENVNKNLFKKIINYFLIERRVNKLIYYSENLVTCSMQQYIELKTLFKHKKIKFHNFPSLVTDSIINGNKIVSEIKNINNYILFFGRIEFYKGIHIAYNEFCENSLLKNKKLIIAGSGNIYFQRKEELEDNITFINRYIEDEEIKDLFSKSSCIIYPYISATQSGVLSLSSYFDKPTIVSNVPFFKECLIEGETGYFFDVKNPKSIVEILSKIENLKPKTNNYFDAEILKKELIKIYND